MGSAAICTAVLAVGLCQRGPSGGLAMALGGKTSSFLGFLVVVSVPGSCRKVGKEYEGCPFQEIFNQNAVFHVLIIISLILVSSNHVGSQRAAWHITTSISVSPAAQLGTFAEHS
ncbi:unnamed protein product [Polarella glacialis]|uniref:Uncharacterized protein n=1 Tax=Polarella glacialis TaxID=89957 RepID=A0A813EYC9_POLGL|nr:unnamed protein product [Polarella glacialis]